MVKATASLRSEPGPTHQPAVDRSPASERSRPGKSDSLASRTGVATGVITAEEHAEQRNRILGEL
jgi:hypothetical protein